MVKPQDTSEPRTKLRDRETTGKALELAFLRLKNQGSKVSALAVAAEVGVTAPLIYNSYPKIAEDIRKYNNKTTRQKLDATGSELAEANAKVKALQAELNVANNDIKRLASINQTLRERIASLTLTDDGKVSVIPKTKL